MYIVISSQNTQLVGVPWAILLITKDPQKAIRRAKQAMVEEDAVPFLSGVYIYEIPSEESINLSQYYGEKERIPVLFSSTKIHGEEKWQQRYYDLFKAYNRRRISVLDKKEQQAVSGKFRLTVLFDSDELHQIDEDFDSREDAFYLFAHSPILSSYPFSIFDDQGVSQVKDGKLIPLVEVGV